MLCVVVVSCSVVSRMFHVCSLCVGTSLLNVPPPMLASLWKQINAGRSDCKLEGFNGVDWRSTKHNTTPTKHNTEPNTHNRIAAETEPVPEPESECGVRVRESESESEPSRKQDTFKRPRRLSYQATKHHHQLINTSAHQPSHT